MNTELDRREFLGAAGAGAPITSMLGQTMHSVSMDAFKCLLLQHLHLRASSAEAMARRAWAVCDPAASCLLSDGKDGSAKVSEATAYNRQWRLVGADSDYLSHGSAALASIGATALIRGGSASLRWVGGCTFADCTGFLFRHRSAAVFVVSGLRGEAIPRRLVIGLES